LRFVVKIVPRNRGALASAELYVSGGDGGLKLVSVASHNKHGNGGTFDIDLPLARTPGVERRVGNGVPANNRV